jgi:hypothetical protein
VLVVDGGASLHCALVGDQLAARAARHGSNVSTAGRRVGCRPLGAGSRREAGSLAIGRSWV